MRRVTFSRNYTLSLSRTCQCYCKYCAFATHRAHIHAPEEVERRLDEALRRNAKELLVLTGERPEVNPRSPPGSPSGATRTSPPTSSGPASGPWSAASCRTPTSASSTATISLGLREVTASQGLMLESISERLMDTVHAGSPTKHPAKRLATIEAAGELRIPFTSGILVGIGETEEERVESLEALAELHGRYGHLQEMILQNFVPHPRYYGPEVADIADDAAAGGRAMETPPPEQQLGGSSEGSPSPLNTLSRTAGYLSLRLLLRRGYPAALPGLGERGDDRGDQAADLRVQAADAGRRRPGAAEPVGLVGGAGRGGGYGPGRALRERGSHLAGACRFRARIRCGRSWRHRGMR